MQQIAKITTQTEQNDESVFVMVPVEQWNGMVEKLQHYEWLENLRRIDREMDEDPDKRIPWDEVKKDLIEKGLLEASSAEA